MLKKSAWSNPRVQKSLMASECEWRPHALHDEEGLLLASQVETINIAAELGSGRTAVAASGTKSRGVVLQHRPRGPLANQKSSGSLAAADSSSEGLNSSRDSISLAPIFGRSATPTKPRRKMASALQAREKRWGGSVSYPSPSPNRHPTLSMVLSRFQPLVMMRSIISDREAEALALMDEIDDENLVARHFPPPLQPKCCQMLKWQRHRIRDLSMYVFACLSAGAQSPFPAADAQHEHDVQLRRKYIPEEIDG